MLAALVQRKLMNSEFYKNATSVSVYLSFGQEIQTDDILNDLFQGIFNTLNNHVINYLMI